MYGFEGKNAIINVANRGARNPNKLHPPLFLLNISALCQQYKAPIILIVIKNRVRTAFILIENDKIIFTKLIQYNMHTCVFSFYF